MSKMFERYRNGSPKEVHGVPAVRRCLVCGKFIPLGVTVCSPCRLKILPIRSGVTTVPKPRTGED